MFARQTARQPACGAVVKAARAANAGEGYESCEGRKDCEGRRSYAACESRKDRKCQRKLRESRRPQKLPKPLKRQSPQHQIDGILSTPHLEHSALFALRRAAHFGPLAATSTRSSTVKIDLSGKTAIVSASTAGIG